MRSRGNISPHTLYYGHPPANSYSTVLGKAYGKAETEFGLCLAKKFLNQINTHRPDAVVTQEHLVEIIELGDHAWDVCAEKDNTPIESEQMRLLHFASCAQGGLWDYPRGDTYIHAHGG
jgi:hypothetical protein